MASSLAKLYTAVYRGDTFAQWEQQALAPADIKRTPLEVKSRERVAEVIRALRREEPVLLDEHQVLDELRSLVLEQTKSLNCFDAFTLDELQELAAVVESLSDWSRLVKLLGQVRALSMKRYQQQVAA